MREARAGARPGRGAELAWVQIPGSYRSRQIIEYIGIAEVRSQIAKAIAGVEEAG